MAMTDSSDGCSARARITRRELGERAYSLSNKRATKSELRVLRVLNEEMYPDDIEKPRTRAACIGGARPCPWVSCAHHLYLDVDVETGALHLNHPSVEVEDMRDSCALDVADRGGETLESVGSLMNLTRERIRQIQALVTDRLRKRRTFSRLVQDTIEMLSELRDAREDTRDDDL